MTTHVASSKSQFTQALSSFVNHYSQIPSVAVAKNIDATSECRDPQYNNRVDFGCIQAIEPCSDSDTETEYDTREVLNRVSISNKHATRFHTIENFVLCSSTGQQTGSFTLSQMILPAYQDGRKYKYTEPKAILFLSKFRVKKEFRGKIEKISNQKYSTLLFQHLVDQVVHHYQQPLCFRPTKRARSFYLHEINKYFKTQFFTKGFSYFQPTYPGFFTEIDIHLLGGTAWLFNFDKEPIKEIKQPINCDSCSVS